MKISKMQEEATGLAEYQIRPAEWSDLEAVTEMLNTWSQRVLGADLTTVEIQRREWRTPNFDLERDTRVAVAPDGQVVAYYEVWDQNNPPVRIQLWGRVHPDHEDRGIGSALLQWAIERAKQALPRAPQGARVSLGVSALSSQHAAHRLFEEHGFTLKRHYLRMVIDFEEPPAEATLPEGITIRSMRRGQEERRVIRAVQEAFRDHWGWVDSPFEETYQRWMSYIQDNPDFDPDLWFVAEEDGQIAGISLCWEDLPGEPELGWVGTLGVLRPWRRRGLGLALLQHSFVQLYQRGRRKVGLGVDAYSLTNATRLYEKAGMHSDPAHQLSFYELELRPGIDISTQQVAA